MTYTEVVPNTDDHPLRAWNWRAVLDADERTMSWLGRRTDRAARTVRAYHEGTRRPPIAWLEQVAEVLNYDWRAR